MSREACNRFGTKPDAETGHHEEGENLSHQDCEDSTYNERDDNGNPDEEGKASFSKDSGNVTLNTTGGAGMLHKIYATVWMCE